MTRKKTTIEFIADARKVHENLFDYSKVDYKGAHKKISIICKKHGVFEQSPNMHLAGNGCPLCRYDKVSTSNSLSKNEFIKKSVSKHGNRYNYSKVKYINTKEKVEIICNVHGSFFQKPELHMRGSGCALCNGGKQRTVDDFIQAARAIHGDKYIYSLVNYKDSKTKVSIICKHHKVFHQTPQDHLTGKGCSRCAIENSRIAQRYAKETFLKLAQDKHGDKYDYTKFEYVDYQTKSIIICKIHGEFLQSPTKHINNGNGCPHCALTGFDTSKKGYLYFLISEDFDFIKIGISNVWCNRLDTLTRKTPLKFRLEMIYEFEEGKLALNFEKKAHEIFSNLNCGFTGFDGATEWFKYDNSIIEFMKSVDSVK